MAAIPFASTVALNSARCKVRVNVNVPFLFPRPITSGNGYLAGDYPDGITTVEGVPTAADIRVLLRTNPGDPADGIVVAKTRSRPDGTWRVDGLSATLIYDVVGRIDGHNDVIMSGVRAVAV